MTWGNVYNRHLTRGEDHGFAAYAADHWEFSQRHRKGRMEQEMTARNSQGDGCARREAVSDLIERLRGERLNCTCAAHSRSECACDTDWPESSCKEAAAEIERLTRERDEAHQQYVDANEARIDAERERDEAREEGRYWHTAWRKEVDALADAEKRVAALEGALRNLNEKLDAFWNDENRPSIATMRGMSVHELSLAQDHARRTLEGETP